jgi:hypothetical protein
MADKKKIVIPEDQMTLKLSKEQQKLKENSLKQLRVLWKKKNFNELIKSASEIITKLPDKSLGDGDKQIAEIYFLLASSLFEEKRSLNDVKKYAKKAAHFDRINKNIQWLIRELKNDYSENTSFYRIQAKGAIYRIYNNEEIRDVFKTVYGIAAENDKEAMKFIKEFERPEITQEMEIVKSVVYNKNHKLPKGIYETMKLVVWFE